MYNLMIILGAMAFSSLPFFTGNLHANQLNNETGSHKKYKQRDSAPYKNLANMLKTAQKKASAAKVREVHKKSKSHSGSFKSAGKVRTDKNKRSLKSASNHKASSSSFSATHKWGSKKLTHRVSKRAGKATPHNSSYSAKHSSKSASLQNGVNRKRAARTATK
jgi:hypothetical protein